METEVLLDGLGFAEGPRWHDGRLWFSDFVDRGVHSVDLAGTHRQVLEVAGQPSGLGWLPDGSLLAVSMRDRQVVRWDGATVQTHADLSALTDHPCNDLVVDASGRAYVSSYGFDFDAAVASAGLSALIADRNLPTAAIYLVEPSGTLGVAADGLRFPNGMVVSETNRTLIVAESLGSRLTAFAVNDDGTLGGRRTWADLRLCGAAPDGIAADPAGTVWVADPLSTRCLEVAEGGTVVSTVTTSQSAVACAVGDRHLFVVTAGRRSRSGRVEVVPLPR